MLKTTEIKTVILIPNNYKVMIQKEDIIIDMTNDKLKIFVPIK